MLTKYYGFLSGLAFSLSYAVAGIFAGIAVDKGNRARILACATIVFSLTSLSTGVFNSLLILGIMRFLLGAAQSAAEPAMYSMISDYFPPEKISTANSVLMAGAYLGGGTGSLSIMLIKAYGWRACFNVMGISGVVIGLLSLLLVREPERKLQPEPQVVNEDQQEDEIED